MEFLESHGALADMPDAKTRLVRAQRLSELAQRECLTGFPLIYAQATVTLWGALEDLIRTFVAKWLQEVPAILLNPPLSTLKVRLGEYENLSPEEKGVFLADALDRATNGALKQGVTRFEALLEPLSLSGTVPDDVRTDIFELGQVRHVIAHRRGIADRKLLEACPWLTVSHGSPLDVSHRDFARYYGAAMSYVRELVVRVYEHFGVSDMRVAQAAGSPKRDEAV
ncbi:MAG: hypothetical protein A3H27_11320 [Acidobacteria bacterium RIFCSPLOWO2_02_FULL_59_13]|nr:MAG: hypothetical protein A3H27_11320 [Acidobacteria bacterium RIFCSPLOWO2_02_FULL_59_13]